MDEAFGPACGAAMRAVDTNVLVRLLVRDDPDQVARAEAFVEHGAWVSLPVLVETVWVMQSVYGLNRRRIGTVVGMLVEHEYLTLQDEDVVRRAHATFSGHTIDRILRLPRRRDRPQGGARSGRYVRHEDVARGRRTSLVTPVQRSAGSAARLRRLRVAPLGETARAWGGFRHAVL